MQIEARSRYRGHEAVTGGTLSYSRTELKVTKNRKKGKKSHFRGTSQIMRKSEFFRGYATSKLRGQDVKLRGQDVEITGLQFSHNLTTGKQRFHKI